MPQKADGDSFETSWDFTRHPLVQGAATVAEAYRLQDELDPGVEDKDVTVREADQMIKIDLDDGVKKNYAIFQDVLAKIK